MHKIYNVNSRSYLTTENNTSPHEVNNLQENTNYKFILSSTLLNNPNGHSDPPSENENNTINVKTNWDSTIGKALKEDTETCANYDNENEKKQCVKDWLTNQTPSECLDIGTCNYVTSQCISHNIVGGKCDIGDCNDKKICEPECKLSLIHI